MDFSRSSSHLGARLTALGVEQLPGDAALLERARSGDPGAVGALYDRFGPALYYAALVVTHRPEAAQAAVIRGFQTATTAVEDGTQLRTWHVLARATLDACGTTRPPQA